MNRALFVLAVAVLGLGCASVRTRAHVMEFDPASKDKGEQKTVLTRFEATREEPLVGDAANLLLYVEQYPHGVIPSGQTDLIVSPASEYVLVGRYDLYATGATTFSFADYTSTGRKVFCYPQVPLTWVTLGIWQFVSPLAWGCAAKARMTRDLTWQQIRHLGVAAGADAAVVLLKSQDDEVIDAWGWLLKKRPATAQTE